jgi:hypothetical protein
MLFIGASAGGFVVTLAGTTVNYVIDSLSFLGSLVCLWRLYVYTYTEMTATQFQTQSSHVEETIPSNSRNKISSQNKNDFAPLLSDKSIQQQEVQESSNEEEELSSLSSNAEKTITIQKDPFIASTREEKIKTMEAIDLNEIPKHENVFTKLKEALLFFRNNRYILALTFLKGSGSIEWGALEMV